jgi:hypothetical protein
MFSFKTNVPEIDAENESLIKASAILESMGNDPGITANEFLACLLETVDFKDQDSQDSSELLRSLTLAAVSIETMMTIDVYEDEFGAPISDPTVH